MILEGERKNSFVSYFLLWKICFYIVYKDVRQEIDI